MIAVLEKYLPIPVGHREGTSRDPKPQGEAVLTDASFCAFSSGRFADSHELSELGEPG